MIVSTSTTGTMSATDDAVTMTVTGFGVVGFELSGTFTGTITFECLLGGTWKALNATPPNSTSAVTTATAAGTWVASCASMTQVRMRLSTPGSGLVLGFMQAVAAGGSGGGGGGGTGGGDASASNQLLEIADLDKLAAQVLDYNTGAGTANTAILGLALPGSTGPVAGGTNTNPVQVGDAGGSLTVDNADITATAAVAGTTAGAAVITDANGTLQQYLRGIVKLAITAGGWLVTVISPSVATATLANVSSSATSVTLQASNASRKGWYCFNDSTAIVYVKFGATASATSYTVQVAAGGYYEMPVSPVYTGVIDGIWASANGNARVTEL